MALLLTSLTFAVGVLNARLLAVLAVLACIGLFGYAVFEPLRERTVVAALFAALVLGPVLWFYGARGQTQNGDA